MKITVRIPTEAYAFQEIQFDSLEEYNEKLPQFIKAYLVMKRQTIPNEIKDLSEEIKKQESPF